MIIIPDYKVYIDHTGSYDKLAYRSFKYVWESNYVDHGYKSRYIPTYIQSIEKYFYYHHQSIINQINQKIKHIMK